MPQLFPGIFYAILAAAPGWVLGAFFTSSVFRKMPLSELIPILARGAIIFTIWFGVITLIYGGVVWTILRSTGFLNLGMIVLMGTLPVIGYALWGIFMYGVASGWYGILPAFGIPALCISVALWWFTVGIFKSA
ncbi:hypothetical protein GJ699_01170 [Duganella sp. FT80W]|uniref:Uncharacterized protein n=1 Tax=Duganella guangzhouensis TaxID=2666084 RepID=A0A6I2KSU1_9BURK|nr:hypothetical protein [Duganella guangzhouensis]MRW88591.1 hypothetical protein [Duganella guangzhouensis]